MNLSLLPVPCQDKHLDFHITHLLCDSLQSPLPSVCFLPYRRSCVCKSSLSSHLHKNFQRHPIIFCSYSQQGEDPVGGNIEIVSNIKKKKILCWGERCWKHWEMLGNSKTAGKHHLAACTWRPVWKGHQPQRGCESKTAEQQGLMGRGAGGGTWTLPFLRVLERAGGHGIQNLEEADPCPACLCQETV